MKKDFEIRIVAKGCDKEFKEGMGKGVLISQIVTLTLPDEMDEKDKERIGFQLYDMGKDLMTWVKTLWMRNSKSKHMTLKNWKLKRRLKMKLTRIRPVGRYVNPTTGRAVNVKTGRRVGRSVDIKFYLLQGTRMLINDREFSENWIKESS